MIGVKALSIHCPGVFLEAYRQRVPGFLLVLFYLHLRVHAVWLAIHSMGILHSLYPKYNLHTLFAFKAILYLEVDPELEKGSEIVKEKFCRQERYNEEMPIHSFCSRVLPALSFNCKLKEILLSYCCPGSRSYLALSRTSPR